MKKLIAVLSAAILCMALSVPTFAAKPTSLTINEVSTAPTLDGVIDSAYGSPIFDIRANELALGDPDLYTTDENENGTYGGTEADLQRQADVYAVAHSVGYAVYDQTNLYLAFDVTDTAPKAASNSQQYWRSSNLQLVFYINNQLCFPTIAYAGHNKVNVHGDDRSELDTTKIKTSFVDDGGHFIYEIVIPWSACPEVTSASSVDDFRFSYLATSMASGYFIHGFGQAYGLKYDTMIPVTMKALSGATQTAPSNGTQQGGSTGAASGGSTGNQAGGSTGNTTTDDGASAPTGGGTDINVDDGSSVEADADNDGASETVIVEETGGNKTLVIILIVVAAVVVIGGAVAIILLNKKPQEAPEEKK